mgnify:CR=1 FL=1
MVGIDATYRVCKDKIALIIFTGINNMGISIILMCCFVVTEDKLAYQFALKSFEDFGFSIPNTVMTDQDRSLTAAISSEWPRAVHLF